MEEATFLSFYRGDDAEWLVTFDPVHVRVLLKEEGTMLVIRGASLTDLSLMSVQQRHRAWQHFMELNSRTKLGRYCGDPRIAFEICVLIEDGELTGAQFFRCLGAATRATLEESYQPEPIPWPMPPIPGGIQRLPPERELIENN